MPVTKTTPPAPQPEELPHGNQDDRDNPDIPPMPAPQPEHLPVVVARPTGFTVRMTVALSQSYQKVEYGEEMTFAFDDAATGKQKAEEYQRRRDQMAHRVKSKAGEELNTVLANMGLLDRGE